MDKSHSTGYNVPQICPVDKTSFMGGGGVRRRGLRWFLALEALLYLAFLSVDLLGLGDSTALKFLSICLVALMAVVWGGNRWIRLALGLTAAADVFLLVLDRYYAVGIGLFCLVQLCYARMLDGRKGILPRLSLAALAALLLGRTEPLNGLAAGYFTLFLCNLFRAGKQAAANPLFFAGLALFFCCDLCVGYYNIGSGALWSFCRVAMWGFYLPGQILILLSSLSKEETEHEA